MKLNKNWKYFFDSRMLYKGKAYYEDGAVFDVEQDGDFYEAVVEGSADYKVSVEIHNGNLVNANCNCPYSEQGNYCKHEVALLYYLENDFETEETDRENHSSDVSSIIESLSEEQAKNILKNLAETNSDLRKKLFKEYSNDVSEQFLQDIKREAISCFMSMEYCYDDDDYGQPGVSEFIQLVEECVIPLITEKKAYVKAFQLALDFLSLIPTDAEDMGYLLDAYASISHIMESSYNLAEENDKKAISELAYFNYKITKDYNIKEFIIYSLKDKDFAQRELNDINESFENGFGNIDTYVLLMEVLGFSENEIINNLYEKKDYPGALIVLANRLEKNGRWQEAIAVLEEGKVDYRREMCSSLILEILKRHNDEESYKKELGYNILNVRQTNNEKTLEMKTLLTDGEWNTFFTEIRNAESMRYCIAGLCKQLGYIDVLMDVIEKLGDFHTLNVYFDDVKDVYPDRVITFLKKDAEKTMNHMYGRDAYGGFCYVLAKLSWCENGKKIAWALAKDAKKMYPKRPALKDELRKIGFDWYLLE